ncbi:hypothetical protein K0M31_005771 [Melipona bicolor]|uniref:Uncharacterized protein n=1 Tax=Melipona bicolor TaxID=60889 RepID=A0AA40FU91_9HYME|nr:hypothetical protein K0M31_005771 [Melipona bicolor]
MKDWEEQTIRIYHLPTSTFPIKHRNMLRRNQFRIHVAKNGDAILAYGIHCVLSIDVIEGSKWVREIIRLCHGNPEEQQEIRYNISLPRDLVDEAINLTM